MKIQTILYLLLTASLCGCGFRGPKLEGTWVIDIEPTKEKIQQSAQWTELSERERKMMEPMMFGMLDDMNMSFEDGLCTVTMGNLEQKTSFVIAAREDQRLILESEEKGQQGRIIIEFLDQDHLTMTSDLQKHMNLYIWKRTNN